MKIHNTIAFGRILKSLGSEALDVIAVIHAQQNNKNTEIYIRPDIYLFHEFGEVFTADEYTMFLDSCEMFSPPNLSSPAHVFHVTRANQERYGISLRYDSDDHLFIVSIPAASCTNFSVVLKLNSYAKGVSDYFNLKFGKLTAYGFFKLLECLYLSLHIMKQQFGYPFDMHRVYLYKSEFEFIKHGFNHELILSKSLNPSVPFNSTFVYDNQIINVLGDELCLTRYLMQRTSIAEINKRTGVSQRTIESRYNRLAHKFGVDNKTEFKTQVINPNLEVFIPLLSLNNISHPHLYAGA